MRLRRKGSLSVVLFLPCVAPLANAQQPMVPISLVSSTQSAVVGQPMTFTATELTLFLYPGASMTFVDNGTIIPGSTTPVDNHGAASFTTTLAAGNHTIFAVFSACCNGSNGVSVVVTVASVPALSQWGLAILAMLLVIIACVAQSGFWEGRRANS